MLQEVLKIAYDTGGVDSTLARYHTLRDRYYGRAAYDFSEVPLADVGNQLATGGRPADAERLLAFNVEMNPTSSFAKRQHAGVAIFDAYGGANADSGAAVYRRMKALYGPTAVSDAMLTDVGRTLLDKGQPKAAVAALQLDVAEYPASATAFVALGDAYELVGDRKQALAAYKKAQSLDSGDPTTQRKVEELSKKPAKRR